MMSAIKDYQICSCGSFMFPCEFKQNKEISYKCISCDTIETKSIADVMLKDNEGNRFFSLDETGEVSWKCHTHGSCYFTIDGLDMRGFVEMGCPLCYSEAESYEESYDEERDNIDYLQSDKAKDEIKSILSSLTEEQQIKLVSEYDYAKDVYSENGDVAEALRTYFIGEISNGIFWAFDDFLDQLEEDVERYKNGES